MVNIFAFGISFFISYILIPFIRKFGIRTNILAYPNERSIHEKPIPTMGGMSFFISFLFSFLLFGDLSSARAFLLGAIIIFIIGLIDDSTDLRPIVKLMGQLVAVGLFLFYSSFFISGVSLERICLFIFLYIFILGIINAINLTDGLDGLAAGLFIISSLLFFYILSPAREPLVFISSLIGGVVAFLFFNFYPAQIFMGDTGSNFLGFSLGVLSFYTVIKYGIYYGILYSFLVLALPILDTLFAIFRRIKNKQPIFKADRGHIHHILVKIGFTQTKAVFVIWLLSLSSFIPLFIIKNNLVNQYFQLIVVILYYIFLIWGIIYINKKKVGGGEVV